MTSRIMLAIMASLSLTGAALAADPLEGRWRTQSGETAQIGACGSGLCITLRSGKHAGKQIGSVKPQGSNAYAGTIIDPADDKSYSGKASLSGSALTLSGCVLGGLICKSQNWTKI